MKKDAASMPNCYIKKLFPSFYKITPMILEQKNHRCEGECANSLVLYKKMEEMHTSDVNGEMFYSKKFLMIMAALSENLYFT